MAQDKEFNIKIGGIKESITNLESLESILSDLESKVKSINEKGGFSVANKESTKAMDELGKLTQKLAQYDEDYQKAVESAKSSIKDKNEEVKKAVELEKANLVVEESAKSTYYEKQQLMSALGKQIKSMTTDTEENKQKQQELIQQYASLNQELKDFDATLGNHQRNVGDYGQATKNLKTELKELQAEMATMLSDGIDKADPKFVQLAQKAGQMKDAINDAGEEIKRFASDTKKLDDVINIAQSATAAFQLYKGAMSAFGVETEAAEEAIQKLAGAMSIIQSLQTLQETLSQGSATAKLFNAAMKVTGAELVTTQLASIKATAAQQGLTTAQKAGTIATKTLSLAIKAIPLMLVIGLVTELILHWEDLVGWFNKTFPILNKLGGAMNALKAVFVGFGKAIINWVTNPLKTLANVISKIFQGDFAGAIKAAADGIKNQFKGTADAFKSGFVEQVNKGQEEMTRKQAAEEDKRLTHHKNMITKEKNADGTYRKEFIDANKKMFENRKKMYKKDSEEYNKVLEDEAKFFQQVEDAKEAATKKSAAERTKANKAASDAAKKAAEEEKKRREQEEKDRKELIDAEKDYRATFIKEQQIQNKELQRQKKLEQERYATGPLDQYIKKTLELHQLVKEYHATLQNTAYDTYFAELQKEYPQIKLTQEEILETLTMTDEKFIEFINGLQKTYKLSQTELLKLATLLKKFKNEFLANTNDLQEAAWQSSKDIAAARKAELSSLEKDANRIFDSLMKRVKTMDVTPVKKDTFWGKIFGQIDEKETLDKLERVKKMWVRAYNEIQKVIKQSETKWDEYISHVEQLYGRDSNQYTAAIQEKMDALEKLRQKALQVAKIANSPLSMKNDYNADGVSDNTTNKKVKSPINPNEYTTKDNGNTNWDALWDKNQNWTDNLVKNFQLLDEMVLAPAMDTFSMFMDFAIEETAQRLEQVQEMHDKALDKVNESADKIRELNEAIKDSGNDNIEATKQQLADEQLLYAQRLAEERKLAEEEKALKNKQAQQEANARKMELRYQMIMAIANTAQGASKALATWGWPLGAIFAGVMAALGAIQVALIAKQIGAIKPVKYAEGGIISGPSHAQGGVKLGNIEVEGGEAVINKRSTEKYRGLLDAINAAGNGGKHTLADTKIRKFANGGQLNFEQADANLQASTSTNKLMSAINDIDMQPIVAVKDIWKVEDRLVRVRGLAGKE